METTWLHDEILDGLSKLLCLSLERTPASDLIEGTAAMWVETLADGMKWERERDAPRIRKAFATLAKTRTTWPAPLHFREALPAIEQKAIGYEVKPVSREESLQIIARLRAEIGEDVDDVTQPVPALRSRVSPEQKAAAEAELQKRYGSAQA